MSSLRLFFSFLLFFSVSLPAEPTIIVSKAPATLVSSCAISYEQKETIPATPPAFVLDLSKTIYGSTLASYFGTKKSHSFLQNLSCSQFSDLQKLISIKKGLLFRKTSPKSVELFVHITGIAQTTPTIATITILKQPQSTNLTMNIDCVGTTPTLHPTILNCMTSLFLQDSWWTKHKSTLQLGAIATLMVLAESQQRSSYSRAYAKRVHRFVKQSENKKALIQYNLLMSQLLTGARETKRDNNKNILYKELGQTRFVLLTGNTIAFPEGTETTTAETKELTYLIPFSKVNPFEIKKNLDQFNRDGWRVYFFDDLGCGDAGLWAFDPTGMHTKIDQHAIVVPRNSITISSSEILTDGITDAITSVFSPRLETARDGATDA
ncbi:hypothetical protein FJ366_01310 [Candidatus Dependentiae bacterium]|nr:hypothetical protein [Candidatus Dependentiae bacterium]